MSWKLLAQKGDGSSSPYSLPSDGTAFIVTTAGSTASLGILRDPGPSMVNTVLGQITVGTWGLKLEAVSCALSILPGHANLLTTVTAASDPRTAPYELQPRAEDGHSEALLLRHGDVIGFALSTSTLACKYSPEVQVTSSAAVNEVVNAVASDGVADTPEEDTEDENQDLDRTITDVKATQRKSQQPQATPQLSGQRSVVVQETPTVVRINDVTDYSAPQEMDVEVQRTPSLEQTGHADAAPYSTARTAQSHNDAIEDDVEMSSGESTDPTSIDVSSHTVQAPSDDTPQKHRHPRVVVSKKRPSPAADEEESEGEPLSPSSKRARHVEPSDDDTQDSRLSNIVVDLPASKKRRLSKLKVTNENVEATPPRSQRSSQRSSTPTSELYEGGKPRVATSNSSLEAKSQAVKFLKKQGGSFIEFIKDNFNVLCVRDGDLHKTSKILYAIAVGTPIVNDKWLLDSAKAGHFLSIDAYVPFVPNQEKEWRFALKDVLGRPHTPFEGYTVHFTAALVETYTAFKEIEQVCKAAGAIKVTKKKMDKSEKVVVLAAGEDDRDAERLIGNGVNCYNKDLLPITIFRGVLDLDSHEFRIDAGDTGSATKETKKKRGRKSAG